MSSKLSSRRHFIKQAGAFAGMSALPFTVGMSPAVARPAAMATEKPITIRAVNASFEREPLLRPYGFKGGSVSDTFHSYVLLESTNGNSAVGVSKQSVLWSDEHVAAKHTALGGNAIMFSVTEHALGLLNGRTFNNPVSLQDEILPDVYAYAVKITENEQLRMNFVLNALVGVDNAAWLLYAAENEFDSFDEMLPAAYRPVLAHRHPFLASVPSLSYTTPLDDFEALAAEGYSIMKIKIGAPGNQREMVEKDKERLSAIHDRIGHLRTHRTPSGKLPYYLDSNGRYEQRSSIEELLDHAREIGAFDQILVLEDPFAVENKTPVHDMGVIVAVDEGAYDEATARERIELGYEAFALKPIAKTFTKSLRVAKVAHDAGLPAYCADLTAFPLLLDWNKSFAARLPGFPGLGFPFIEVNGHQNYRDWDAQISRHPMPDAPWIRPIDGVFELSDDFYEQGGGIFKRPAHYYSLVALDG